MAVKVLETKAIISAQDNTGTTFAQIADKLRKMEGLTARAGQTAGKIGGIFGDISPKASAATRSINAMGVAIAGVAALGVAKLARLAESVVDLGAEFDKLTRKQQAVLNISAEQQKPLIAQAIRLGGTTPYNDIAVLEAQTALVRRGIPLAAVQPITEQAAVYAQAQGIPLPEAATYMESAYFAGGGRGSPEEINKNISHLVDLLVKTSQTSGMDAGELAQFAKFGLPSAHAAGVSEPFFFGMGATMKRAGLQGEEAGVATRAFVGAMLKPTAAARNVFDALGVHYADFAKAGPMSAENLSATLQRRQSRTLTPAEIAAVNAVIANPELAGDQGAFTAATAKALGAENLKPNDASKLAKVIGDFWTSSLANIDVEGLLKSVLAHGPTAAQDVSMFGTKQGGRFATLASHAADLREFEQKIAGTPEGLAAKQAAIQMGGFSGAQMRLEGAWRNVLTTLYRDNEKWLTPLYNAGAKLETMFVEASDGMRNLAEAAAAAAVALVGLSATITGLKVLDKLAGGGTVFGGAARAGGAALGGAASMVFGAPMALAGGGLLASTTGLNVGENERARQQKYGQGPYRWLGNAPPEAGKFSGASGPFKLEGSAVVTNKIEVDLAPGLVERAVSQAISAEGNLRTDTGVSMPPSMMPYGKIR